MRFFQRKKVEVNSSSMADIAFLLLIFFLVTTTIQSNMGLNVTLPPHSDDPVTTQVHNKNLFKIHVNSRDQIMVEDEAFAGFEKLHEDVKKFILNNGQNPELSESPEKAVVSLHLNRGTRYLRFIEVMDAVQGVYYEIYGERVGLTAGEFRLLDLKIDSERAKYDAGRKDIPMNISIAEPNKIY